MFEAFYCEHTNPKVKEKLGMGIAIGGVVTPDGLKVLVLWDKMRHVSPSAHGPSELAWLSLVHDPDDDGYDDDEEEVEEEETEVTNDGILPEDNAQESVQQEW